MFPSGPDAGGPVLGLLPDRDFLEPGLESLFLFFFFFFELGFLLE